LFLEYTGSKKKRNPEEFLQNNAAEIIKHPGFTKGKKSEEMLQNVGLQYFAEGWHLDFFN
jgi:hypothetical protein